MQSAFVASHGAPYLARCAAAIDAGLAPSGCSTEFLLEDWRFPPAFLPFYHWDREYVSGAWISDPVTASLDVIELLRDGPAFTAIAQGRSGLRLLASMLELTAAHAKVGSVGEPRVRAFVDVAFPSADAHGRGELVAAAIAGFDPDDDNSVRKLPILREL